MKYVILVALCIWFCYELYVLVKTIIEKRKTKKIIGLTKSKLDTVDTIIIEDNLDSKN